MQRQKRCKAAGIPTSLGGEIGWRRRRLEIGKLREVIV